MKTEIISENNIKSLTELFVELWPDCSFNEGYENCERILQSANEICYLVKEQEAYVAFIYGTIRTDYVEGSAGLPVAYLEGIYVKPDYRRQGIAKKLVEFGEEWGKQKGCTQLASDTELSNTESIEFHKRTGFGEVSRIVCFIKNI